MSKPVAYAAVAADGSESVYVASLKEQAEACCRENGWFLLPLYAAPLCHDSSQKNLTEAEHDALEFAVETGRVAMHDEATLRNLLERMS